MELIEYRLRPVTRYVVTRYHESDNAGSLETLGEYDNEEIAYAVGYALCKAEGDRLGWPIGDERLQFPVRQSEQAAVVGVPPNAP